MVCEKSYICEINTKNTYLYFKPHVIPLSTICNKAFFKSMALNSKYIYSLLAPCL